METQENKQQINNAYPPTYLLVYQAKEEGKGKNKVEMEREVGSRGVNRNHPLFCRAGKISFKYVKK